MNDMLDVPPQIAETEDKGSPLIPMILMAIVGLFLCFAGHDAYIEDTDVKAIILASKMYGHPYTYAQAKIMLDGRTEDETREQAVHDIIGAIGASTPTSDSAIGSWSAK